MRFRAKGPAIYIAWAIGPGLLFLMFSKAQRVGRLFAFQTVGPSGLWGLVAIDPGPMARAR